jgi:hypothetical protein
MLVTNTRQIHVWETVTQRRITEEVNDGKRKGPSDTDNCFVAGHAFGRENGRLMPKQTLYKLHVENPAEVALPVHPNLLTSRRNQIRRFGGPLWP